jgi:hypothetical protein
MHLPDDDDDDDDQNPKTTQFIPKWLISFQIAPTTQTAQDRTGHSLFVYLMKHVRSNLE